MKPFEQMNNDVMQSNATLSSAIIEDISGIETIKSLSCENHCFQKINKEFFDYLNKSFKLSKYSILQTVLKQSTQLFLNVIMLWLGAQLVIDNKITIGQLIAFNALFSYFIHPLENIINLQTKLQSARVATTRLNEVYLVKSEFQDSPMITNPETLQGKITLKDVHYKYGFGKDTLSNINLQILPGEKIAFVGASGSGKTTLAKIIVNFFEPNKGYIHINGNNLKYIDKRILRQYINYLPQQAYIFSGSILENLTLSASQSTTQADIINACKIANIHSDIESMPRGYETELSDGSGLSGGQKQRIALARGLLSKAPILILDEATSGLDTLTEKKVVDNLLAMTDKTIIFVAHRLSIAERVDQVIVLDNGQIIEQGSHKELFKPNKF